MYEVDTYVLLTWDNILILRKYTLNYFLSSGHNKYTTEPECLKQQTFISHSSESWEVQDQSTSKFSSHVRAHFLACRWLPSSCCPPIAEREQVLVSLFMTPIPSWKPHPQDLPKNFFISWGRLQDMNLGEQHSVHNILPLDLLKSCPSHMQVHLIPLQHLQSFNSFQHLF